MKEVVSIHIGQAGNQIGFAIWELLCAEHGIGRDGMHNGEIDPTDTSFETFFQLSHTGRFVPRGLFVDMEPTVIDQLRKGSYAELYHPMQLISGNDDSSGNFSRAYHTVGRLLYGRIEHQLRRQIEACDYIQTLIFHRSLAGGAGSGLTSMVFELLDDYSKTIRLEFPIHPAPHFDSSVVSPYNSILAEHFCLDECDVGLLLDNEALFDICTNLLEVKDPTMTTINRILGQVCSNLTAATRFHNDLCNDVTVVLTNLVPYPRIHFPLVSFAPLGNTKTLNHDEINISSMTHAVFDNSNQLVKCDPSSGKYMSCSLVYRGLVSPCEVYSTLGEIKMSRRFRFVDWCPTGFKIGIVDQPPVIIPESVLGDTKTNVIMMTNSSSVSAIWQRLAQKFHRLYAKRSFIHWFVSEGLEESEFCEALFNLATLAKDYEEVAIDTHIQIDTIAREKAENAGEEAEDGRASVASSNRLTAEKSTSKEESNIRKSSTKKSNTRESSTKKSNTRESSTKKSNTRESNIKITSTRESNSRESNTRKSNTMDSNLSYINHNCLMNEDSDDPYNSKDFINFPNSKDYYQLRKDKNLSTDGDLRSSSFYDDLSSAELVLCSPSPSPFKSTANSQTLVSITIPTTDALSNSNSNNITLKSQLSKSTRKSNDSESDDEYDFILDNLVSLTSIIN